MKRLVLTIVLLTTLISLNTYYYLYHEKHEEYPGNEEVVEGFTGKVSIGGTVITVIGKDSSGFYILVEHGHKSKTIKILSNFNVEKGDKVEVLGLLHQDKITPEKIMVYKKWSYYSIFIRSALAIPIVAYVFLKHWRFDLRDMRFKRRKNA
jgi:hypothetical protein